MRDFLIQNHGTIWIITPLTEAAEEHCNTHFGPDTLTWAKGYVVEPRYVADILIDLEDHGFILQEPGDDD